MCKNLHIVSQSTCFWHSKTKCWNLHIFWLFQQHIFHLRISHSYFWSFRMSNVLLEIHWTNYCNTSLRLNDAQVYLFFLVTRFPHAYVAAIVRSFVQGLVDLVQKTPYLHHLSALSLRKKSCLINISYLSKTQLWNVNLWSKLLDPFTHFACKYGHVPYKCCLCVSSP